MAFELGLDDHFGNGVAQGVLDEVTHGAMVESGIDPQGTVHGRFDAELLLGGLELKISFQLFQQVLQ